MVKKNFNLCSHCFSRILNSPSAFTFSQSLNGSCDLCSGLIDRFLSNISIPVLGIGERTFSLSIKAPKEILVKEEEFLDYFFVKNVKAYLSSLLREKIEAFSGLSYKPVFSDVSYVFDFPSAKVEVKKNPLFIFGRYKKFSQWISQKRWDKYEESVEALIAKSLRHSLSFSKYYMHASGREDVDALNYAGRPFVMELHDPSTYSPNFARLKIVEGISIQDLFIVDGSFVNLVTDSHFDKCYRAYLSCSLTLEEQRKLINALKGVTVSQKTPTRVLHRRVDKWRKRKVYSLSFGEDEEGFYAEICGEAGLYIKELISGDNGRTKPSFSSVVGKPLECTKLIVTEIHDGFLDSMLREKYGTL